MIRIDILANQERWNRCSLWRLTLNESLTRKVHQHAARFTKKASDQSDSGVTTIKVYRSTKGVGVLPFNSKTFVLVRAVADAINDWEQSKAWAKTGKLVRVEGHSSMPRDDSLEFDEQDFEERPHTRKRMPADDDRPRVQDNVSASEQRSMDVQLTNWIRMGTMDEQVTPVQMDGTMSAPKLDSNPHAPVYQLCHAGTHGCGVWSIPASTTTKTSMFNLLKDGTLS